jgi:hypothetical protein
MNPDGLFITRHAMERFTSRWLHAEKPECWQAALRLLLEKAEPEELAASALRLLNANFQPAQYFVANGWRLVFDESGTRLLTCERIIFKRLWQRKVTDKDRRRKRLQHRKD